MKKLSAKKKKTFAVVLILGIITGIIISYNVYNSKNVDPVEDQEYYLDTVCKLSVYRINGGLDKKEAQKAIDRAYDRCRELDKTLSNTVATSDISRINDAGGQWVTVGDDAITVIKGGIEYGEKSDGAFDITIGSVSDLWDFHSDDPKLPDQAALTEALTHVDYRKIQIDGNRVRLLDPEAKIDLGGIAKGYISDQMADVLTDEGVTSAVVNLGGNIVAIGNKPNGDDFVIGIEKPYSDRSEIIGKTHAKNETVITSGVYERQFKIDGKVYHHILSTKTGYPVDTDLDSVSITLKRGKSMDVDAMSTICLIKGSVEGKKFIEGVDGAEAVFCKHNGDITMTKGMDFTKE